MPTGHGKSGQPHTWLPRRFAGATEAGAAGGWGVDGTERKEREDAERPRLRKSGDCSSLLFREGAPKKAKTENAATRFSDVVASRDELHRTLQNTQEVHRVSQHFLLCICHVVGRHPSVETEDSLVERTREARSESHL